MMKAVDLIEADKVECAGWKDNRWKWSFHGAKVDIVVPFIITVGTVVVIVSIDIVVGVNIIEMWDSCSVG